MGAVLPASRSPSGIEFCPPVPGVAGVRTDGTSSTRRYNWTTIMVGLERLFRGRDAEVDPEIPIGVRLPCFAAL